jgi:hypothetical protein
VDRERVACFTAKIKIEIIIRFDEYIRHSFFCGIHEKSKYDRYTKGES